MRLFNQPKVNKIYDKARVRTSKMSRGSIYDWLDTTVSASSRELADYYRTRETRHLIALAEYYNAQAAIIDELIHRTTQS